MRFPRLTSPVLFTAFLICAVWAALVITAPLMVPSHTLTDLSGSVGIHDNDLKFQGLSPLPHALYWIGDGECHQIASRSFFLNGNEMPFCSRDVGLFLGLAAGFMFVSFRKYKIKPVLALIGLVPLGLDGGIQLVTSYESNNPLRLATGILAGLAFSLLLALFVFTIQEDRDRPRPSPATRSPEKAPIKG